MMAARRLMVARASGIRRTMRPQGTIGTLRKQSCALLFVFFHQLFFADGLVFHLCFVHDEVDDFVFIDGRA